MLPLPGRVSVSRLSGRHVTVYFLFEQRASAVLFAVVSVGAGRGELCALFL